jgi:putative transcriptional regulator
MTSGRGHHPKNPHWGTPLDTFLNEEGIREAAKAEAVTRETKSFADLVWAARQATLNSRRRRCATVSKKPERRRAMTKPCRSPVMASIHETAERLHAAGVMDTQTMRKFDDACLTPGAISALPEFESPGHVVFAHRKRQSKPVDV